MRIPSGKTDQTVAFVAQLAGARVTGLSSFTVYRSRNGGTATIYTTPTVTELSAANMPGVYVLLIDEDTTIASTSDSEEMTLHITATGMDPVTRAVELYRRDITSGRTAIVDANGLIDANMVKAGPTASGTAQTAGDIFARLGAPAGASMSADVAAVKTDTAAIKAKTDSLTFTIAGQTDSNIQYVNDVLVTGNGSAGTPWGP